MPCIWTHIRCWKCGYRSPVRFNVRGILKRDELNALRAYFLLVAHKDCPGRRQSPHMRHIGRRVTP